MIGLLMQKVATTNMYCGNGFCQVTVLKTQSPKILKILKNDRFYQIILGFFALDEKHFDRYNTSFLNGCFQDTTEKKKLIKSFTVPQMLVSKYNDSIQKMEDLFSKGGNVLVGDIFSEGLSVNSQGMVKGRGFTGGMKRHNFHGLRKTHGVSVSHRSIGSTGCRKPNRVIKGRKMPGRYGGNFVTIRNLSIVKVDSERELLIIKGSVPGASGSLVRVVLS